jgi:hypothetical protein
VGSAYRSLRREALASNIPYLVNLRADGSIPSTGARPQVRFVVLGGSGPLVLVLGQRRTVLLARLSPGPGTTLYGGNRWEE